MPIVHAEVCGGLGNQFFIIFSCIATALRDKADFVIEGSYDNSSTVSETNRRRTYWDTPLFKEVKKYAKNARDCDLQFSTVFNEYANYDIKALPNTNDCVKKTLFLVGYMQCPSFFDDYAQEITSMLCIDKLQANQQARFPEIESTTCSMHFRLGDYKTSPHRYVIMPLDYYKNSLEYILEKTNKKLHVLWCCHNPDKKEVKEEYITKLIDLFPQITFQELPNSETEYEELLLMSLCDHHIIPNSTFSWWSAYLCKNKDKIVCYPETWYGHPSDNAITNEENKKRMFPSSWHEISFKIDIPNVPPIQRRRNRKSKKR